MRKVIEVTPQDSFVPVYEEVWTAKELEEKEKQSIIENQKIESARLEREAKLESALNKLKSLGLTESEAKIIIGLE